MPMTYRHAVALLIVIAGLHAGIGPAYSAEPIHLVARAAGPVPQQSTIAVQASEADERSAALAQAIARSLEGKGFHVSDDGGLTLEFRIDDSRIAAVGRNSRLRGEAKDDSNDQSRTEDSDQIRIELEHQNRATPRSDLQIEFFLYEKGRPPIWSATIEAPRSEQDEDRQLARMVQIAMDAFGKSEDRLFETLD